MTLDELDLSVQPNQTLANEEIAKMDHNDDSEFTLRGDVGRQGVAANQSTHLARSFDIVIDGTSEEFSLRPVRSESQLRTHMTTLRSESLARATASSESRASNESRASKESRASNESRANNRTSARSETRVNRVGSTYKETSGLYPVERHYPTLESLQRLYRAFGYASVFLVVPYLGFRLLYIAFTVQEGLMAQLGEFSQFAVPLLIGIVALTACLFGISEGIKLAIDIQENTLRIANRDGRQKVN